MTKNIEKHIKELGIGKHGIIYENVGKCCK